MAGSVYWCLVGFFLGIAIFIGLWVGLAFLVKRYRFWTPRGRRLGGEKSVWDRLMDDG